MLHLYKVIYEKIDDKELPEELFNLYGDEMVFYVFKGGRKMKKVVVGLIKGRHKMPVDKYIFEEDIRDMFDYQAIRNHISDFIDNEVGVEFYQDYIISSNRGQKSLVVYVTGLTSVACELVDMCNKAGVLLTLMHYDRETGSYRPQYLGVDESVWY